MKYIKPAPITGKIRVPGSKSYMQRITLAGALAYTPVVIQNPDFCQDSRSMLDVVQQLGTRIERQQDNLIVHPGLKAEAPTIYCGESGLCMRMMAAVLGLFERPIVLTGHENLLKRPLPSVEKPLRQLGVHIQTHDGFPPAIIEGPLHGGKAEVDGAMSSQFLSGLLMALPRSGHDTTLTVSRVTSIPYINITLHVLKQFGVHIEHENYGTFHISGRQKYRANSIQVEGDWSAAAFWLAAAALGGSVTLSGLRADSLQGDKLMETIVQRAGAQVQWQDGQLICRSASTRPFETDLTECPDLFPPVTALAAGIEGRSRLSGCHRLTHKESNRARVLVEEFRKIGVRINQEDDMLVIDGGSIPGGTASSHNDHRIAMALAIAGIHSKIGVTIEGEESVAKSYPDFFYHLNQLTGGCCE